MEYGRINIIKMKISARMRIRKGDKRRWAYRLLNILREVLKYVEKAGGFRERK